MSVMTLRFAGFWALALLSVVLTASAGPARALETVANLYAAQTVITGQDNPSERTRGVRETLLEVLVKVTGDARIKGDIRLPALLANAEGLVSTLDYEDRHGNKPINHEQGTRDRSFILRVRFDEAKISSALMALGRKPWTAERPRTLVLLGIKDDGGTFVLTDSGTRGQGQREVLRALSVRRGLPIAIPEKPILDRLRIRYDALSSAVSASAAMPFERDALLAETGADALLIGVKTATPRGYWDTVWTLVAAGQRTSWTIKDQSFDRTIENGLETAARHLAGIAP